MSRLIPAIIPTSASNGEKLVFSKLKNDPACKEYIVIHSLFLSKHLRTVSGEIDFLILAPGMGIFVLEVKHGRVARKEGMWEFTDKFGNTTTTPRSPFRQASDAMHSLRNFLIEKSDINLSIKNRLKKILFGYGVMFTGISEFYDYGTEAEPWMVYTRQGLNLPISLYIDSLSKGFHDKMAMKSWYDINHAKPSFEDCQNILSLIRGDFEYSYKEINKILDLERSIESFTQEQFNILDVVNYNDRCLFSGPAGTGKTLMAIELFRRSISNNQRVGFFCFNKLLGNKISLDARRASKSEKLYWAGTIHSFITSKINIQVPLNPDNIFFQETLPWSFIFHIEDNPMEKFDFLIIDEAQDLITENYLEVFENVLNGGLEKGNWVFFGDFSNQAIYLNNPEKSLELITGRARFTHMPPLKINCRNTRKIVQQTSLLTGVSMPELINGALEGDKVEFYFPATKPLMAKKILDIIAQLEEDEVPLDRLVILSQVTLENSCVNNLEKLFTLVNNDKIKYHTIQSFKGMESSYVILTDLYELDTKEAERLLYVGLSRAKLKLYLVLSKELAEVRNQLISKNLKLLQKL